MKIAVTSTGPTLDDAVEMRFGRCAYFLIIDPDTMEFEALPNPNISLGGGAGIQSAQLMADKGVAIVLTGNCGPNAFQTFGAAGIQVITAVNGQVRQAVGLAAHSGDHDYHIVTPVAKSFDLAGDILDAIDSPDRGTSIFLNNQCHCSSRSKGR